MIEILITIITFSFMLMLFKYFEKYAIDNLQAIIVNYLTAGSLAIFSANYNGLNTEFSAILNSNYFFISIIIGFLFIVTFNLLAHGTQKVGIAVTTVSNKMSMVIPVVMGIYLFHESFNLIKFSGLFIALIAIYLSSVEKGKLNFNKKYILLITLIFLGQGIADSSLNWAQKRLLNNNNLELFFGSVFYMSAVFGVLYFFYKVIKQQNKIQYKSILWGIALGVPNYFTLYFFIKALKSELFESSEVFPIVNMGIIILSALGGIILFREKLSLSNWAGIALAILAIGLISF